MSAVVDHPVETGPARQPGHPAAEEAPAAATATGAPAPPASGSS